MFEILLILGECPQYIGMISKHQPTIPDSLYLPDNSIESETETVIEVIVK